MPDESFVQNRIANMRCPILCCYIIQSMNVSTNWPCLTRLHPHRWTTNVSTLSEHECKFFVKAFLGSRRSARPVSRRPQQRQLTTTRCIREKDFEHIFKSSSSIITTLSKLEYKAGVSTFNHCNQPDLLVKRTSAVSQVSSNPGRRHLWNHNQ